MAYLDVRGASLFLTDDGQGDPPLLLVHGWTCDSHDWSWQLDRLADRHRVVAVDLRGHGRSSVTEDGYHPGGLADDLAEVMERLVLGPAVVVGHSLGAMVATALAVEHPALVQGVVAVEPAYGLTGPAADALPAICAALKGPSGLDTAAAVLAAMEAPDTPVALKTWHRRRVLGMNPDVVAACAEAMYRHDDQFGLGARSAHYIRRRSCPVLALWADPERAEWERALMTHSSSQALAWDGAGHWLHQERPDDFARLLLAWVHQLPAEPVPPSPASPHR